MKKNIMIIAFLLLLLIPFRVNAASIGSSSITQITELEIGKEYSISLNIGVNGIQKGDANSLGIWLVTYELEFDDSVIIISDISSNQWNSILYKDGTNYYVLSEVSDDSTSSNKCFDGVLYCSDYNVTIKFYVKDTKMTSTSIRVGDVEMGLLGMLKEGVTYTEDDMTVISGSVNKDMTASIKHTSTSSSSSKPSSIVENSKPTTSIPKKNNGTSSNSNIIKSSNRYLKKLEIKNYKIDFNKLRNEYEIEIDKTINNLDITAATEHAKATYKIIGADDLKSNNYVVKIEVTAENGAKNTYTITAKVKEERIIEELTEEEENITPKKKEFTINKKYVIIGAVIAGTIFLLIIIISIIIHSKDRKLEKALDEL